MPRPVRKRVRLIVMATVFAVLAIVLIPAARRQMDLSPARRVDDDSDLTKYFHSPRPGDATKEWLAALALTPPDPTFDEAAPAGMQWDYQAKQGDAPYFDPLSMLTGEWRPEARPALRWLARSFESDSFSRFFEAVTPLCDKPFVWRTWIEDDKSDLTSYSNVRATAKLVIAQARFLREARHDDVAAARMMINVLSLVRNAPDNLLIALLVATACEATAETELAHQLQERPFDAGLANDLAAALDALPTLEDSWKSALLGERALLQHDIELSFSDDGRGDGRLVLACQPDAAAYLNSGMARVRRTERSRAWNLLAPLYNGRRDVEGRLDAYIERVISVRELPYRVAVPRLLAIEQMRLFDHADGPWLRLTHPPLRTTWSRAYQLTMRRRGWRRAMRIMLALNNYKLERGEFPDRLDQLVPQQLSGLPADPFSGASFGYVHHRERSTYDLYSCGTDGDDDYGQAYRAEGGEPQPEGDEGDSVYTLPRRRPLPAEPVAIPLQTPGGTP